MLQDKTEFLFNILMMNEIPFIRIKGKKEFILLDHKVRIATFEAEQELKFQMKLLNYKDYVFNTSEINPILLSKILGVDWISKYKNIRI